MSHARATFGPSETNISFFRVRCGFCFFTYALAVSADLCLFIHPIHLGQTIQCLFLCGKQINVDSNLIIKCCALRRHRKRKETTVSPKWHRRDAKQTRTETAFRASRDRIDVMPLIVTTPAFIDKRQGLRVEIQAVGDVKTATLYQTHWSSI